MQTEPTGRPAVALGVQSATVGSRTTPAQVFLEGAVKDLERLKSNAELHGGDLALIAYLLDMALIEAREQQGQ